MTRRLTLHIDRLVLDGLAPDERRAFARGLRTALAAGLRADLGAGERQANPAGVERLDAGVVRVPADAGAFDIGARAARQIVGSMAR